jgi:hypothetical protein
MLHGDSSRPEFSTILQDMKSAISQQESQTSTREINDILESESSVAEVLPLSFLTAVELSPDKM